MSGRPTIFMPIETIDRELDARILVGLHLAARGFAVAAGDVPSVHALALRNEDGIYLGKNVFSTQFPHTSLDFYMQLKTRGFRLVHLDEEGAFFPGPDDELGERLDQRLDPTVLAGDDLVLTWGERQAAHYRRQEPLVPIVSSGHPRFDLYSEQYRPYFADEVASIRERHGDFVLLNTTGGLANNRIGLSRILDLYETEHAIPGQPSAPSAWADDVRSLAQVVDVASFIASEVGVHVVVRPHPAEDADLYESLFRRNDRVSVRREGPVAPWILAAKGVVHDGCTTAVEAELAGVPVAVIRSSRAPGRVVRALAEVGHPIVDLRDLESLATTAWAELTSQQRRGGPEIEGLLANLSSSALETLVACVTEMEGQPTDSGVRGVRSVRLRGDARQVMGAVGRRVVPLRREQNAYARQKFYGLKAAGAETRLRRMMAVTGIEVPFKLLSSRLMTIG